MGLGPLCLVAPLLISALPRTLQPEGGRPPVAGGARDGEDASGGPLHTQRLRVVELCSHSSIRRFLSRSAGLPRGVLLYILGTHAPFTSLTHGVIFPVPRLAGLSLIT